MTQCEYQAATVPQGRAGMGQREAGLLRVQQASGWGGGVLGEEREEMGLGWGLRSGGSSHSPSLASSLLPCKVAMPPVGRKACLL